MEISVTTDNPNTSALYDYVKKNVNPQYVGMVKMVQKWVTTHNLYFKPFEIGLPHGRGAGTSTAIMQTILFALERDLELKHQHEANLQNPKWVAKHLDKSYHVAQTQNRERIGDVLMVGNTPDEIRYSIIPNIQWCLHKMGLEDRYTFSAVNKTFQHRFSGAIISCKTKEHLNRTYRCLKYLVLHNADQLDGERQYYSILGEFLPLNKDVNSFCFLDFNVPYDYHHWINVLMRSKHSKDYNFLKVFATYRTMPRDWLGEYFFKEAELLKKTNPKIFENEFLGKSKKSFKQEKD